jgi:hypothetical protein
MKHYVHISPIGCSWIVLGKYNKDIRWEYVSRVDSFYYKEDKKGITPITYIKLI